MLFLFYDGPSDPLSDIIKRLPGLCGPGDEEVIARDGKKIQKSNRNVRIIWLAQSLSWVKIVYIKSFFFFFLFEVREDDLLKMWRWSHHKNSASLRLELNQRAWGHKIWLSVRACSLDSDLCDRREAGGRESGRLSIRGGINVLPLRSQPDAA